MAYTMLPDLRSARSEQEEVAECGAVPVAAIVPEFPSIVPRQHYGGITTAVVGI